MRMSESGALARMSSAAKYCYRGARLLRGFVAGRPMHCIVQVTNRCNLTCSFCNIWQSPLPAAEELTIAEFERVSTELARGGTTIACLEGGEPLLREDVADIVRAFARHHFPLMFTNGWLVTEANARAIWAAGLTEMGVSLDYSDAARHDAHRGREGTFQAVLDAVEILRETAPLGGRQVVMMTVLMKDNEEDLEELLRLSERLRVRHQVTLLSTHRGGQQQMSREAPSESIGQRLLELRSRYPHLISFGSYLRDVDRFLLDDVRTPCWAGRRFVNIDQRGNVAPCVELMGRTAGNLATGSWADVVEGMKLELPAVENCTECFTSCRGLVEVMSGRPRADHYFEFFKSRVFRLPS